MSWTNQLGPSLGLLVMRLLTGGMLIYGHGWPKLMNWSERMTTFADPIGLGSIVGFWLVVLVEVPCSVLVMLGWLTRFACLLPIGFFLVAAFIQHWADPFGRKELPLLYLACYVCLLFAGPGRFSVDAMRGARRERGWGEVQSWTRT